MMLYVLLFVSVLIDTLKNICYNQFSKNRLQTQRDAMLFNVVSCAGSVLFFVFSGASPEVSAYSMVMAVIFAVVTVGSQYFALLAMSLGSMSYSVLFSYLSMLIPVAFGILYYGQPVKLWQIVGLILMLITFVLSVDLKENVSMSLKWLLAALGSFVMVGLVGICQQLHQNSEFAGELEGFLLWTFLFSTVMFLGLFFVMPKRERQKESGYRLKTPFTIFALLSGVAIGAINQINLYLSGRMPSVIFFPIVSGGVIILSGLAAILIFREKLTKKQQAGLLLGMASVLLLGM